MPRYEGLQIVTKTFAGIRIGFVVGWWFYPRRYYGARDSAKSFRSIRNGLLFPTLEKAQEFRDGIEKARQVSILKFEAAE